MQFAHLSTKGDEMSLIRRVRSASRSSQALDQKKTDSVALRMAGQLLQQLRWDRHWKQLTSWRQTPGLLPMKAGQCISYTIMIPGNMLGGKKIKTRSGCKKMAEQAHQIQDLGCSGVKDVHYCFVFRTKKNVTPSPLRAPHMSSNHNWKQLLLCYGLRGLGGGPGAGEPLSPEVGAKA